MRFRHWREAMYRLPCIRGEAERVVPESELRRTRLHLSPSILQTGVSA